MQSEPRVTPAEVLEAYKKTGLKFITGKWWDDRGRGTQEVEVTCGCPMTALYFAQHPEKDKIQAAMHGEACEWAQNTYGTIYTNAFTDGVDGTHEGTEYHPQADRRKQGIEDGQAVFRACIEEFKK